jgi:hypothetical protein
MERAVNPRQRVDFHKEPLPEILKRTVDNYGVMPHRIEVFSGNCPLCNEIVDELEAGKCARCELIVHPVSENMPLARQYGVRVVPTVIIDGEVKIEGRPDIPFVCSDETYAHFKEKYPLTIRLETSDGS